MYSHKRLYRTPRVLSLLFLLFMLLLSLDVFDPSYTWQEMLIGFIMHNIPTLIVGTLVAIARKHELVGAISFAGLALLYLCFVARSAYQDGFERYLLARTIEISGLLCLIARLFRKGRQIKK